MKLINKLNPTVGRRLSPMEVIHKHGRDFVTFGALIVLVQIFVLINPSFISPDQIIKILTQASINAVLAIGLTFVILTAGIDLSVGSILALSAMIMGLTIQGAALVMPMGLAIVLGVTAGLIAAGICGFLNGFFVVFGEMHPFIPTLGMMSIARGAAQTITNGKPVAFPDQIRWVGTESLLGIPVQVLICIILYVIVWWVLKYTRFGRYTYAVGGNEEASRLSGILTGRHKIIIYVISGLMAGIAALIYGSQLGSVSPTAGLSYELDAIAAVTIGGTSQRGGEGKIFGSLIGALLIVVLRSGLTINGVQSSVQLIIIGFVIILSVMFDMKAKRR